MKINSTICPLFLVGLLLSVSFSCKKDSIISVPTITVAAVTNITNITATSGGEVTSDGGAAITARGVCWSTIQNPTLADSKVPNGIGSGGFTILITGLTPGTLYYVRAYASNSVGTSYSNQVSFTTILAIGDNYQGGKIAYILQSGDPGYNVSIQHGIIAAPGDQSIGIVWWNGSNTTTGATASALGSGNDNTNTIVVSQGTGNYAAKVCYDLILGGYNDWYLPSKDELNKLYLNKDAIGGFVTSSSANYWSSTEGSSNSAWEQYLLVGSQSSHFKSNINYVRAIRSF